MHQILLLILVGLLLAPAVPSSGPGAGPGRAQDLPAPQQLVAVTGQLSDPDGNDLPGSPTAISAGISYVNLDNDLTGSAVISGSGRFSFSLPPGLYLISIDNRYPQFVSPEPFEIEVFDQNLELGEIFLLARNAEIRGRVSDTNAIPIVGARVEARRDGELIASTDVLSSGDYLLQVPAGSWQVGIDPDSLSGPGYFAPPDEYDIEAQPGITPTIDFVLEKVAANLQGQVVDAALPSSVLTDVVATAYARDLQGDYISTAPVRNGTFALPLPAGQVVVGVDLAPFSAYNLVAEVTPTVVTSGTLVTISLARKDATIRGQLRDERNQPLGGIDGFVTAFSTGQDGAVELAEFAPDGSYSLSVAAGSYLLSFSLDDPSRSDTSDSAEVAVTVAAGQTVTRDLVAAAYGGQITGQVRDENNQPLPFANISILGTNFVDYRRADATGLFTVEVPLANGTQPALYRIGTAFSCLDGQPCYINGEPVLVAPSPRSSTAIQQISFANINARRSTNQIRVQGRVSDRDGNGSNISVYFDPEGLNSQSARTTNTQGSYSLNIASSGSVSQLDYTIVAKGRSNNQVIEVSDDGSVRVSNALLQQIPAVDLSSLTALAVATMPPGLSQVVRISEGGVLTLDDGASVEIPPGAIQPNTGGETEARVIFEPTPFVLPSDLHTPAVFYGYNLRIESLSGIAINRPLLLPALLTLPFDLPTLQARGAITEGLLAARQAGTLWLPADTFVVDSKTLRVSVPIREQGSWALVQQRFAEVVYLPIAPRN